MRKLIRLISFLFLSFLVRECQLEGWKVSVERLNHGTENSLVHRNPGKWLLVVSIRREKGMAVVLFRVRVRESVSRSNDTILY